jgi:rubrerythrin
MNIQELVDFAGIIKQNELLMGELYSLCQNLFPDFKNDFLQLEQEEINHAMLADNIIEDIKNNPENWEAGNISIVTAKNVNKRLREGIEEIKNQKVSPGYAITFALSIELSLSEKNFNKVLIPGDKKFVDNINTLANGFSEHYNRLLELEKRILKTGHLGFDDLNKVV